VSRAARLTVFLVGATGVAALLVGGLLGLRGFGHYKGPYGYVIVSQGVQERHATNVVNTIVFDYRGFDTVGEEFILFGAVIGVTLLLRVQREEHEESPHDRAERRAARGTSDAVRVASLLLIAPLVLLGMYVVVHGHLTPGGGFQGGVILAAAPLMVYAAGRYVVFRRISPVEALDLGEGLGAAGFVVVGLVGMVAGSAFLQNVFGLGQVGSVFSAGTLPVINLSVGLEVAAGVLFVAYEMLEQTLMVRK
jgi:multicomponent Na+:H+ antiporter subunit B